MQDNFQTEAVRIRNLKAKIDTVETHAYVNEEFLDMAEKSAQ